MKTTGVIYNGTDWRAVVFYNAYADIYKKPSHVADLEHIAHISYGFESRTRSMDVFLIEGSLQNVNIKKSVRDFEHPGWPDFRNNINYQIVSDIAGTGLEWELMSLARTDIAKFCNKPAKVQGQTSVIHQKEIIPVTKIGYIHPKRLLQDGKQDFVPYCLLTANLDLSLGCTAGWIPSPGAYFDDKYFVNFFQDIIAECEYCYALYQHKTFAKSIVDVDTDQLLFELTHWSKEKPVVDVLRMGKRTEAGSIYTRKGLVDVLKTCVMTGTQVVFPTKFLEYDPAVAELFKKTKSIVLYSIGWDEVENGPVTQGFNNAFRLEQAAKYREAGVKTAIYLLIDATQPAGKRENDVMEFARRYKIPIQFLPLRVFSRDLATKIMDSGWEGLKSSVDQLDIFEQTSGGYTLTGNGLLTAEYINPFWRGLIDPDALPDNQAIVQPSVGTAQASADGIASSNNKSSFHKTLPNNGVLRMCHHNSQDTFCGSCFLKPGAIQPTVHVDVNYERKMAKGVYYGTDKPDKNQGTLDL